MNGRASRLVPYLLAFFSSLCIMILELVASRLVARHVGASLSVWTSVIGIMLGGICLGNVLGGRLADRLEPTRALGPALCPGRRPHARHPGRQRRHRLRPGPDVLCRSRSTRSWSSRSTSWCPARCSA